MEIINYQLPITKKNKTNLLGQSLFEVIIAVGVAALVLVAVLSLSTSSVRNTTFSRNDSVATKYAQEATEWLRQQRDLNWTNLSSRLGRRCISATPDPSWGAVTGSCPGSSCSIGNGFNRCVVLTSTSPSTEITAEIFVEWSDGQGNHNVKSKTVLTNWK